MCESVDAINASPGIEKRRRSWVEAKVKAPVSVKWLFEDDEGHPKSENKSARSPTFVRLYYILLYTRRTQKVMLLLQPPQPSFLYCSSSLILKFGCATDAAAAKVVKFTVNKNGSKSSKFQNMMLRPK